MSASTTLHTIYVAQVVHLSDSPRLGEASTYREAVFSSWAKAREFLAREELDYSEKHRLGVRLIIREYSLDDDEPEERTHEWVFDISGNLLEELLPDYVWPGSDGSDYSGKYAVGDIVWVRPNIDCRESRTIDGYFGVVVEAPKKKDDWLAEHRPADDWEGLYVVYYINETGDCWCHSHETEKALDIVSDSDNRVPHFLRLYSKHCKGQVHLPEQLLVDLREEKVFLRDDLRHYQVYLDA